MDGYLPVTKYAYDAAWAQILYHNTHRGTVLFASATEAKSSTAFDKYSILGNLDKFKTSGGVWEMLLEYPGVSGYNRWKQTSNPATTSESVTGYTAVNISWNSNSWGGLALSNSGSTLIDGSINHGNWFYAIGSYTAWSGGVPGASSAVSHVSLWNRIDDKTAISSTASITRSIGDISANGTYYVWVKDVSGNASSMTVSVTKVDTTNPTASVTANSATVAKLTSSDNVGVSKYYWGTSNPASTNVSWSTSLSSSTPTVSAAGTYYLGVQDAAGNLGTASIAAYSISYNANGGSGAPSSHIKLYGSTATLSSTVPTKTGYTFSGWNTNADGTGTSYAKGASYTGNANVTLYAQWTPNTYTITYAMNGGTKGTNAPTSGTFDKVLTINNPTKSGYTFKGWTFNGNTSTVKYGSSSTSVSTAWSNTSTKVDKEYFINLTPTNGATVTMTANWEKSATATFYYYNGSKISSTTSSCTMYNAETTCSTEVPEDPVRKSKGVYNGSYAGLSSSTGSMSTVVSSTATSVSISSNATYYAVYRTSVPLVMPTSASTCGTYTLYRNEYFTSTSAMNAILHTSSTATSNGTVAQVSGWTFAGLATAVNSTVTYSTVAAAAKSTSTSLAALSYDTVSATFYYQSNATSGSCTVSSKAASAKQYLYCTSTTAASVLHDTITTPSEVSGSVGKYNSNYSGLWYYDSDNNIVDATQASTSNGNKTYFATYSSSVTIYRPSSTTAATTQTFYRNEYVQTTTTCGAPVLATTSTGTENGAVTQVSGWTFAGLATAVDKGLTYTSMSAAAGTNITKFYSVSYKSVTATIYYQSNATSGSCTVSSATASDYQYLYLKTTTTSQILNSNITVPSNATSSVGKYNSAYSGLWYYTSSSTTAAITQPTTAITTYYATYSSPVTIYYSNTSSVSLAPTLYRNEWVSTTTTCSTPVLATTSTGTSNYTPPEGYGGADWYGLTTTATSTTRTYSSISAAAQSDKTTLYTLYQMSVTYSKGSNVSAIGSTSGSCIQLASGKSCTVTLPTITANTYYTSVGWSTTKGATTGTAAGSSYTLSKDDTTLYANAKSNSYTITYVNGSTTLGTSTCSYGVDYTLKTWSNLSGSVSPSGVGWQFYGWSIANNTNTISAEDGVTVSGSYCTGSFSLYAVYWRYIYFYSGLKSATYTYDYQVMNPTTVKTATAVTAPTATAITNWTWRGWRNDNLAGWPHYEATTSTSITPAYNGSNVLYASYTRTFTITYDHSGDTSTTSDQTTQYGYYGYLSSGNSSGTSYPVFNWTVEDHNSYSGYTFGGWLFNKAQTGGSGTMTIAAGTVYDDYDDPFESLVYNASPYGATLVAKISANTATITIKKDGSAWSSSGMNVALYSGSTLKYAYSSSSVSGSTVKWSAVVDGTYNVYAGKNSGATTSLVDTGVDITVSSTGSATINYYTLTLTKGTGIGAASGAGTYLSNQTASISAQGSTGYHFTTWSVGSGNKPASTTTASTTVSMSKATSLTANAAINTYYVQVYADTGVDISALGSTTNFTHTYGNSYSWLNSSYVKASGLPYIRFYNLASATVNGVEYDGNYPDSVGRIYGSSGGSVQGFIVQSVGSTAQYKTSSASSWSTLYSDTLLSQTTTYNFRNLSPTNGAQVYLMARLYTGSTSTKIQFPTITKSGYTCGWFAYYDNGSWSTSTTNGTYVASGGKTYYYFQTYYGYCW